MHLKNISRTEMRCAQTREFDCTKKIVEELQNGIHGSGIVDNQLHVDWWMCNILHHCTEYMIMNIYSMYLYCDYRVSFFIILFSLQ